jgi:hypothetical protein
LLLFVLSNPKRRSSSVMRAFSAAISAASLALLPAQSALPSMVRAENQI